MQHKKSRHLQLLFAGVLFSMLAHAVFAQELGLKMQQELLPQVPATEESPLFIEADRIRVIVFIRVPVRFISHPRLPSFK